MLWAKLRGKLLEREGVFEDGLTSAVFERLAYLSGPTAWGMLRDAVCAYERSSGGAVDMSLLDGLGRAAFEPVFWPGIPMAERRFVEPDVLLVTNTLTVIVEAKRVGLGDTHTVEQLRVQQHAVRAHAGGDVATIVVEPPRMLSDMRDSTGMRLWGMRWCDLADIALDMQTHALEARDRRVLADMLAALALAGVRAVRPLQAMHDVPSFGPVPSQLTRGAGA